MRQNFLELEGFSGAGVQGWGEGRDGEGVPDPWRLQERQVWFQETSLVSQPSCVSPLGSWQRHRVLGRQSTSLWSHRSRRLESFPAGKMNRTVELVGQARDKLAASLHLPPHLPEL